MDIRRILYPTDFSPCARQALGPAISFARRYDAELHLLHAVVLHGQEPHEPMFYMPAPEEAYAAAAAAAERELTALAAQATAHGVRVVQALRRDYRSAGAILEYAGDLAIDLIVLGTHGRRGPARLLLGSVAEEVMRTAPCPVLAVRPLPEGGDRPEPPLRSILVPYDFSPAARRALEAAADLARRFDARPVLLHVVEERLWPEVYGVDAAAELLTERERARERAELGMRDAAIQLAPEVRFDVEVRVGRPAAEIVAFTSRPGVDLVVMGTRGQTGVRRLVFGSTAEEVARLSSAPVMVVKGIPAAALALPAESAEPAKAR